MQEELISSIKYQTLSKSINLDSMQSGHVVLTFSELSKISGISKITYKHSAGSSIITYSQNISGNKVDTYFVEYAGKDGHSVSISITAFEIP